ncbi:MAG TPA: hypothetical protein VGA53_01340 [Candidatus Paceibacterota bacterium]
MRITLILTILLILAGAVGFAYYYSSQKSSSPPTEFSVEDLNRRLEICESIPNGTTLEVTETTRMFINLPEDIYPYESREFTSDGATAGIITSGEGLPPQNRSIEEFMTNRCVTHYYEFNGAGTVDLRVKSAVPNVPDYTVHFQVEGG